MASLVVTIIGKDRSGLVDSVSGVIAHHGGNWEESHMSHLAGQFAGIVLVTVADPTAETLSDALEDLETTGLLSVTVERSTPAATEPTHTFSLDLVGQDRPGIIHDIAHALAAKQVSIAELETSTRSAPMAGGTLFEAKAILKAPLDLSEHDLGEALQGLADKLLVDIELNDEAE
ncbi:MAG: glycine cleavage system protein R [Acidimicrobiales bacterium]